MWDARRLAKPALRALPLRVLAMGMVAFVAGCGDEGFLPTTIDPGADFAVADVVFDEGYFYCKVEPMLFQNRCGSGDPAKGDASGGCHFAVTSFRLTDYMPRVSESCSGNVPGPGSVTEPARQNYRAAQARMKLDPDVAPLLTRPTGQAAHPRVIFAEDSDSAEVIREWANQFASQ